MANVKWKPDGYHTVTPYLAVKDAPAAIEFYKKAFGAQELHRMDGPGGKIMHAEIKIGDSIMMLSEEMPEMGNKGPKTLGGSPITVCMYVENVDATFEQATKAGAKVTKPLSDMFWGDRSGYVEDPFGHKWALMQHIEDVSPEEMKKRGEEFSKQMASAHK